MTAAASAPYPFKGSDGSVYENQTLPIDVTGSVPISAGGAPAATAARQDAILAALASSVGLGAMQAVPAATPNGTPLGAAPPGAKGVRLYLPTGASLTYTIASIAPAAAPAATFTVSQSGTGPNWDEDLAGGQMIYVTAVTGTPLFRWY